VFMANTGPPKTATYRQAGMMIVWPPLAACIPAAACPMRVQRKGLACRVGLSMPAS